MGEHVDDAGIAEAVAFAHEYGGIAGEGGGVAGNVHDTAREVGGVQGLDEGVGAAAGRVEQDFIEIAPAGDGVFGGLEEVGTVEAGAFGEVVEAGVLAGTFGELKLPRPQKRSAMRSPGWGCSSCMARATSRALAAGLTWVKSPGR